MKFYNRLGALPLAIKTLLLLLALFFIYSLNYHFFDGILPIHAWRKADSLSLAWNYYKGASFLTPETNHISIYGNRNAAAEFPVVYYLVGNLWKIFGPHEWIAKLVSFFTLIVSLSLFSSVVNYFLKSQIKTLVFSGIIFSSPILLFYSDTLLPNVFSFSFALIAGYFLFIFLIHKKYWLFSFFTLFLTLAILIKVTVLIAILTFAIGTAFYFFFQEKSLFTTHRKSFLWICGAFVFAFLATFLWYSYAINYNSYLHSTLFSTTIRPIWEVDALRQKAIWDIIWKRQFNLLYNYWALIPTIVFVFYLAIRAKILSFFYWILGVGITGAITYILLWFWVFDVHDYYLIEMLFLPLTFFFIAIKHIEIHPIIVRRTAKFLFFCILVLIFLNATSYVNIAFGRKNFITENSFGVSKLEKENWEYFHWYHSEHLQKLQKQKYEIQKIIKEKDTVFCLTDQSPNVDLYTIERIGFSNFSFLKTKPYSAQIPTFIKKGARYMLVVGNEPIDPLMNQFTKDTVYAKNAVFIFDLKSYKN
jgi:cell division protein FtsL